MTLDNLVTQLRAAYGERLVSVVLYGSAASGENIPKKSDYNTLVLLDRIDSTALAAASAVARAWNESGNPPPLTMTTEEWRHSADVFPMEYADILDRNRVLFGAAPFDGIVVSRADLRLQLENQAMGKLLQLRQGMLLAGTDGKRLVELLENSFSTIMVIVRAALRLAGEKPAADHGTNAGRIAQVAGLDATPFLRISRHVKGESRIAATEARDIAASYLSAVERLNAWLDTYSVQEGNT
jgi:hypothetical protein